MIKVTFTGQYAWELKRDMAAYMRAMASDKPPKPVQPELPIDGTIPLHGPPAGSTGSLLENRLLKLYQLRQSALMRNAEAEVLEINNEIENINYWRKNK
jgi:hypothetical protein